LDFFCVSVCCCIGPAPPPYLFALFFFLSIFVVREALGNGKFYSGSFLVL